MKTKEEILKRYGDKIREAIYQQELKPVYRPVFTNEIQNILYEAIAQTREETIRVIPEEMKYDTETDSEKSKTWIAGFNNCRNHILNKLKK